jgi:nucleoside-triphosphatase THEP1
MLGVLMPDVNGKRKIYSLALDKYFDVQADEPTKTSTITVGKFHFKKAIFKEIREILLLEAKLLKPKWLIIDEIGGLEMQQGQGFEPAVSQLIADYQHGEAHGKLLLVVRASLLKTAIKHYGLEGATIIQTDEELKKKLR